MTAKDPAEVEHLKYLSTQAKDDPHFYIHNEVGYNYRMTNLQAALGVAQMEELPEKLSIVSTIAAGVFGWNTAFIS